MQDVSTLQLYRQWHTAHEDTIKMSFTEAKAGSAITWLTVEKLTKQIKDSTNHPSEGTDESHWNKMLEIELQQLSEFHASAELMIQKPVARHPRCNLYDGTGKRHYSMKGASIPLICYAPMAQVKVKSFTNTKGYTMNRSDEHNKTLVIERLHVYYVEGGRKRVPLDK
jgi:hypothetical protein